MLLYVCTLTSTVYTCIHVVLMKNGIQTDTINKTSFRSAYYGVALKCYGSVLTD
jgi:hypothetical protein